MVRSATARHSPTEASGSLGTRRFARVDAGGNHTCGAVLVGQGFCWGVNLIGQLGDGTHTRRLQPTPVNSDLMLPQISAAYGFSCGVAADSRAYCWGHNYAGQLGDGTSSAAGTNIPQSSPVPVAGPS